MCNLLYWTYHPIQQNFRQLLENVVWLQPHCLADNRNTGHECICIHCVISSIYWNCITRIINNCEKKLYCLTSRLLNPDGAFRKPFIAWKTPPPIHPIANAPPQSSTIRYGQGSRAYSSMVYVCLCICMGLCWKIQWNLTENKRKKHTSIKWT